MATNLCIMVKYSSVVLGYFQTSTVNYISGKTVVTSDCIQGERHKMRAVTFCSVHSK